MGGTRLDVLDRIAVTQIAGLLGVQPQLAPYRAGDQPVYQLAVPNRTLGVDVQLLLWPGLQRADVRIGDCAMVFKEISSIELYPGIEVMFRRTDPPGHLFLSVSGRAEMAV